MQLRCDSGGQELCRRSYDGAIFAVLAKKRRRAVLSNVELRHLCAVIVLAEELNFTRAAHRLHITQPALSKQIIELEDEHRFQLFTRDKRRVVELTDAGRIFVEEARSALLHADRAAHLAHAAQEGSDRALVIGQSPYADLSWISAILAIHLPLYPKLRICITSQFPAELVRSVLTGEINIGLVTAPPLDSQITAVPFTRAPVYVVLPDAHPAARKERFTLGHSGGRMDCVRETT